MLVVVGVNSYTLAVPAEANSTLFIVNHQLQLNLNLLAASLKILLNRWAVDNLVGKSMKLINIIQ